MRTDERGALGLALAKLGDREISDDLFGDFVESYFELLPKSLAARRKPKR